MTDDDPTDAELVERLRETMQAAFRRAVIALGEGKTIEEFFESDPLPSKAMTVAAVDLREIGFFDLDVPEGVPVPRRHWVCVRKTDGAVFAISWKTRLRLQAVGFADIPAMVQDPNEQN